MRVAAGDTGEEIAAMCGAPGLRLRSRIMSVIRSLGGRDLRTLIEPFSPRNRSGRIRSNRPGREVDISTRQEPRRNLRGVGELK